MNFKKSLLEFLRKFHPRNVAIELIEIYKLFLSPYFGKECRFYPTCSSYAIDAFRKKGFIMGLLLTIWRILRCNPFCKGGYDPVK